MEEMHIGYWRGNSDSSRQIDPNLEKVKLELTQDRTSLEIQNTDNSSQRYPFFQEVLEFFCQIFKNRETNIKWLEIECSNDKEAVSKLNLFLLEAQNSATNRIKIQNIFWNQGSFSELSCQLLLELVRMEHLESLNFFMESNEKIHWLLEMTKEKKIFLYSTNFVDGRIRTLERYQLKCEELKWENVENMIENYQTWPINLLQKQRFPEKTYFQVYGNISENLMRDLKNLSSFDSEIGTVLIFNTCDTTKQLRITLSDGETDKMLQGILVPK